MQYLLCDDYVKPIRVSRYYSCILRCYYSVILRCYYVAIASLNHNIITETTLNKYLICIMYLFYILKYIKI